MRRGTNSSGPGGLPRRALRMGWLVAVAAGLMLTPGMSRADGQSHGRSGHFGGGFEGGWRGNREFAGWGVRDDGSGSFQARGHESQHGDSSNPGGYGRGSAQPGHGSQAGHGSQPDAGRGAPGIGPGEGGPRTTRPGQEHLRQWWAAHHGLSPQQQADAMRREPGFQSLPPEQQERLLNRLRNLDSRPPQVQQRMLDRVEMFEHLSPERQQEVRGASQAFSHMDPQRKQIMIRAFRQLRQMPPGEREQMLHSQYGQQFSPQERTVLGNLLAIEPYQPQVSQPYFGRP